ncbi:MAG: CheR family methyltransferase, partial [Spirochaetota bacterium]
KMSTILRRIERRMATHQIVAMDDYVKYLQGSGPEATALYRDLLIGVTGFFRDPEVWEALEERIIPGICSGKLPGAGIRVWSAGCSTGEEAYSLAILLVEGMEAIGKALSAQVFATDIDERAITKARAGLYPASIAADLSPERLARFFSIETDLESEGEISYRVSRDLREMLVFSAQDISRDPPFSKLDLLSCRNLLIYLEGNLQKKLISLFHYAIIPGGTLLLGNSETIGEFSDLYEALDRKLKFYRRREDIDARSRSTLGQFRQPATTFDAEPREHAGSNFLPLKVPLREIVEQGILAELNPAAALVNGQGDIIYLHGRTGRYLEPSSGEVGVANILKMAREGLKQDLTLALHRAEDSQKIERCPGLVIETEDGFIRSDLAIRPILGRPRGTAVISPASSQLRFLVILKESPSLRPSLGESEKTLEPEASAQSEILRIALRTKEEYSQTIREELETSNEELRSSVEEMQSVNEEMQSTNEELETSKEELYSVNEELATVNSELQEKIIDLNRANNDMNNLLTGTGIATIFVDHQLRILRFTPTATGLINLIPADLGRPVSHIVSNLVGYDRLAADTQAVLDSLIPRAVEVQARTGVWYLLRIIPYRTQNNVIEGAVITFSDISEAKQTALALEKANDLARLAVVLRDSSDAITVQDLEGRIIAWNPGASRLYGWSEAEALAMNVRELIPELQWEEELERARKLSQSALLEPWLTRRVAKSGALIEISVTSTALVDKGSRMYAIATTERAKV